MAPSAGAQRPGFTLIEIVVVLMGLALVAAAVVPSISAAGRQGDLDRTAARVAASARFARETAIELQATVTMTVETTPDAVRLSWQEEGSLPTPGSQLPAAGSREPAAASRAGGSLPGRFAFVPLPSQLSAHLEPAAESAAPSAPRGARDSGGVLRFPADGRPEGGLITLMDDRGRERRILVMPETGVVRIERDDG
jgi:type II secretory pathway pseudopilin PulG